MNLIAAIIAFLQAVPILNQWYQDFHLAYYKKMKEINDENFLVALKKANEDDNTEDLQDKLGSNFN